MKTGKEWIIEGFGENGDLTLFITKDSNYRNICNVVQISAFYHGRIVGNTEETCVTEGMLYRELDRIYHYRNFKTF